MPSQEKLDAMYAFQRSRHDEEYIAGESKRFLEGAQAYVKQFGASNVYRHRCSCPIPNDDTLSKLAKRLRAQGFRVTYTNNQCMLVMKFSGKPSLFSRFLNFVKGQQSCES